MNEHTCPVIVHVALRFFWKHCGDPKAECMAETQEEWDEIIEEFDRWCVEQ